MFNSSSQVSALSDKTCFSPALKGGVSPLPVPAPGPGNLNLFVGPMVPHFGNHNSSCVGLACVTGGMPEFDNHHRVLRDSSFDCDALDAPDFVPSGGATATIYSRFSLALFHEYRAA